MAIQSAINKMIGTAATAVAVGSKLQEDAEKEKQAALVKEEEGLAAKEKYHEAAAELTKLQDQTTDAENIIKESNKTLAELEGKRPGGKGNTKAAIEEKRQKALTDRQAAERAFNTLQEKIAAKAAVQARAEKVMRRTGVWGGKE